MPGWLLHFREEEAAVNCVREEGTTCDSHSSSSLSRCPQSVEQASFTFMTEGEQGGTKPGFIPGGDSADFVPLQGDLNLN